MQIRIIIEKIGKKLLAFDKNNIHLIFTCNVLILFPNSIIESELNTYYVL